MGISIIGAKIVTNFGIGNEWYCVLPSETQRLGDASAFCCPRRNVLEAVSLFYAKDCGVINVHLREKSTTTLE